MEKWLKGLLSAIIGGAANAVTVMVVDPTNFNLNEGLAKLGTVALVSAIVAAAMYLKQSPLPGAKPGISASAGRIRIPAMGFIAMLCALGLIAGAMLTVGCANQQTATQQITSQTAGMAEAQRYVYISQAMLYDFEGIYQATAKTYLRNEQTLGTVNPGAKQSAKKALQDMKAAIDKWRALQGLEAVLSMEKGTEAFHDLRRKFLNDLALNLNEVN